MLYSQGLILTHNVHVQSSKDKSITEGTEVNLQLTSTKISKTSKAKTTTHNRAGMYRIVPRDGCY